MVLCYGNENAKILADAIGEKGIKTIYTSDRDQLDQWMRDMISTKDVTLVKGPVNRLLSKSVDQVFGTSLHYNSEHYMEYTEGDFRFRVVNEKEAHDKVSLGIAKYNGKDRVVTIPNEYRGAKAFTIAKGCFENNNSMEEINIPEPIYNIASKGFNGCKNLKTINFPKTLKDIDRRAFSNCKSLEEVILPEGVIEIGERAFKGDKNLKSVYLPSSIGHISEDAFDGCGKIDFKYEPGSYAERFVRNLNAGTNSKKTKNKRRRSLTSRIRSLVVRIYKG